MTRENVVVVVDDGGECDVDRKLKMMISHLRREFRTFFSFVEIRCWFSCLVRKKGCQGT